MPYDDEPLNFEEAARLQNLDEQIDQRLRGRPRPPDAPDALDPELLGDLRDFYQPRAQAFQGGLDRVWNRLEQRGAAAAQQSQPPNGPNDRSGLRYERIDPMRRVFRTGERWSSRLTTLVAAVLLVVLVGGLTLGLILVHRPGNGTAQPQTTVTPTARASAAPSPSPGSSQAYSVTSIHMIDATTGWAQGVGTRAWRVLHTTDGGARWQDVTPSSAPAVGGPLPAYYLNASVAWVIAPASDGSVSSTLFKTTNGGQTWQAMALSSQVQSVEQMIFINTSDGWMLANTQGATGNELADLFRTTNGGATWTKVSTTGETSSTSGTIPFEGQKTGVSFLDASTGWLTGFSDRTNFFWLYVTHDGGVTWQQQTLPLPPGINQANQAQFEVMPPTFFNAQDGVMPVQGGSGGNGAANMDVYVTHDGGTTWQSTSLVQASDRMVDFIDANHGWATDGTTLFSTSDGGQTWQRLAPGNAFQSIISLNFVSNTTGWAISQPASGAIALLKTTDDGQSWSVVTPTA